MVLTFNQAHSLKDTLNSIVNQNFPMENVEIVVGEDKSTDNTKEVLKEYVLKYKNIHAIYNPKNYGIVLNYINVLKHCRGKYIMACAGDDYWLPNKIKFQFDFMENHPEYNMIFGNWIFLENGILNKISFQARENFLDLLFLGNNICAPSVCWRFEFWKDFLKETKIEEKKWQMEDYPLWLFLAQKGKIKYIDSDFCVYRVLENSASHFKDEKFKSILQEKNNWEIRLFFASKYAKEYLNYLNIIKKEKLFHSAFNYLWNHPFNEQILKIALENKPPILSLFKKTILLKLNSLFILRKMLLFLKKIRS